MNNNESVESVYRPGSVVNRSLVSGKATSRYEPVALTEHFAFYRPLTGADYERMLCGRGMGFSGRNYESFDAFLKRAHNTSEPVVKCCFHNGWGVPCHPDVFSENRPVALPTEGLLLVVQHRRWKNIRFVVHRRVSGGVFYEVREVHNFYQGNFAVEQADTPLLFFNDLLKPLMQCSVKDFVDEVEKYAASLPTDERGSVAEEPTPQRLELDSLLQGELTDEAIEAVDALLKEGRCNVVSCLPAPFDVVSKRILDSPKEVAKSSAEHKVLKSLLTKGSVTFASGKKYDRFALLDFARDCLAKGQLKTLDMLCSKGDWVHIADVVVHKTLTGAKWITEDMLGTKESKRRLKLICDLGFYPSSTCLSSGSRLSANGTAMVSLLMDVNFEWRKLFRDFVDIGYGSLVSDWLENVDNLKVFLDIADGDESEREKS